MDQSVTTMTISKNEAAIIGYAARLPGAENVDQVWEVLVQSRCTISDIPDQRWSSVRFFDPIKTAPGKTYVQRAGTIDDPFSFDAEFFGISPLESSQMDPQQRILLETVAHAIDHAGINPTEMERERTGVYVGASAADHSTFGLQNPKMVEGHFILGNTLSILANRISYHWNFRGPSFTIDTACSSALFALDQARAAIESGEVDTAIVAGVNIILSPIPFIGFSKASMLSADGLCRAFAKGADGYVRSEGAVVFVLRRLDLARTEQDNIRSVLVGTATNTDGQKRSMTIPSTDRQAELMERVIDKFNIDPNDIAFVEAHGTGTPIGDPIEATAIGRSYGLKRAKPLPIGSSKTNFGHLEPVSGLVGLLKAQLALENNFLPASLHCEEPNPDIDCKGLNLKLVQDHLEIPVRDKPWFAAINSFGFGGANAHAVIRQPSAFKNEPETITDHDALPALRLTAASKPALKELAKNWQHKISCQKIDLGQAFSNANHRLTRHRFRLCLPPGSADSAQENLTSWLDGSRDHGAVVGEAIKGDARVGFIFSGNGAVKNGMARELLDSNPVFRRCIERISRQFEVSGAESVVDLMMSDDLGDRLLHARVAQPLLFAIQVALVEALKVLGLRPHAVLGHSVGEVAAAHTAGMISLQDAVEIIVTRSNALEKIRGAGTMAGMAASKNEVTQMIIDLGLDVEIAAENASENVTVTGKADEVARLLATAREMRIAGKRLAIDYPYHSRFLDDLRSSMCQDLKDINGMSSEIAFYSGWSGAQVNGGDLDTQYWWKSAREMVRFRNAVKAMSKDNIGVLVEISPVTVLRSSIRDCLTEEGRYYPVVEGLGAARKKERPPVEIVLDALASGAILQGEDLLGPKLPFLADLPTYPFDRKSYVLDKEIRLDIFARDQQHVLLGGRLSPDSLVWHNDLSVGRLTWLGDHVVDGRVLLPATCILEMFVEAASQVFGRDRVELRDLEIYRPLQLKRDKSTSTRVVFEPSAKRLTFSMRSGKHWTDIAIASVAEPTQTDAEILNVTVGQFDEDFYPRLGELGLDYGKSFAKIRGVSVFEDQVDAVLGSSDISDIFRIDPTLADSGLHSVAALLEQRNIDSNTVFLPGRMGRVQVFSTETISASRVTLRQISEFGMCLDVKYLSAKGRVVASIDEFRFRPASNISGDLTEYWEEVSVPLGGEVSVSVKESVVKFSHQNNKDQDDIGVLRDAIAGRCAWDIVANHPGDTAVASGQLDAALQILSLHESVEFGDQEKPSLIEPCPWPEINSLVDLLVQTGPKANTELHALLGHLSASGSKADFHPGLSDAALVVLQDMVAPKARVLLVGPVDAALVEQATKVFGHVSILAKDEKNAEALIMALPDQPAIFVGTLQGVNLITGKFDLVVGVDVVRSYAPESHRQILGFLRYGGEVLFVEEDVDAFARLLRRHRSQNALEMLTKTLCRHGTDVVQHRSEANSSIRFFTARATQRTSVEIPAFHVVGSGELADGLRNLSNPDGVPVKLLVLDAEKDLFKIAISQPFRFAQSDSEGTTWIIQRGLVGSSTIRGWRRSIVNETRRDIRTMSVEDGVTAERVVEMLATTSEREITICLAGTFGQRILPADVPECPPISESKSVLRQQGRRSLNKMDWRLQERKPLRDNELEIQVIATGLNYRDIMWAQGLLPVEALEGGFTGPSLGMECSGYITRVGSKSKFTPGDKVMAFASGAFSSHVTTASSAVMALPENTDLIEAASIPVAFLTADYALKEFAQVKRNETVLIHGATGGVGLAAIQIARNAGLIVIATAGSAEKRLYLKTLGVTHILDSRSLEFADKIAEITSNAGIDVVLNSLAGEAMERGLGCLAPFGRFVELGKRGFLENSVMATRVLRKNISYFGMDIDQLLLHRPTNAKRAMRRIAAGFEDESLTLPPLKVFPAQRIRDAFQYMQQSHHIGKILVTPPTPPAVAGCEPKPIRGTWLVLGGTSGFGLETAKWLANSGARSLWLASRSGQIPPDELKAIEAAGVSVHVSCCDATNEDDIRAILERIEDQQEGLAGVVNSALVLDDARFENLDQERIRAVIEPKIRCAMALDKLTRRFSLDHFILFGSAASRFGSQGQSAYVVANLGMEEIVTKRVQDGFPGLVVSWGPISDVGYLARNDESREIVARQFGTLQSAASALKRLDKVLANCPECTAITISPVDWSIPLRNHPVISEPLFEALNIRKRQIPIEDVIDLQKLVEERGKKVALKAILEILTHEAATIMRMAPSDVDVTRPLQELGFDSLMGLNLVMAAEERLGPGVDFTVVDAESNLALIASEIVDSIVSDDQEDRGADMVTRHLTTTEISNELADKVMRKSA